VRDLAAFLVLWAIGWWLLWRFPGPGRAPAGARPPVSVVVPARDEAGTLPPLLESLARERQPGDEVLVVDDHSTDATAEVAAAGGARVVSAPDPPPGWAGKPWACATGVEQASSPLVVFLDADARLERGGLDRVAGLATGRRGLVSLQPFHLVPRPVERLAAFCNLVGVMGTGAFTPRGDRAVPRGAFGPCLATSVDDYRRAGGHAAVAGAVLDDVALAGRYRAAGLPVTLRSGRGVVAYRMYAGGLRPLVEGFTKNLAGGAGAAGPLVTLLVAGWLAATVAPAVLLTRVPAVVALGAYALVAVQVHVHLRRLGSFGPATAALYALPLAVFLGIFVRSLVVTALGRPVRWKGRSLPTRRRRRRGERRPTGSTGARPRSP
jgi:4,4'-diaponeurosporenoate glycosyltransferase